MILYLELYAAKPKHCCIDLPNKALLIANPKGLVQRTLGWPYFQVFPQKYFPEYIGLWNYKCSLLRPLPNHTNTYQTIPYPIMVKVSRLWKNFFMFDTASLTFFLLQFFRCEHSPILHPIGGYLETKVWYRYKKNSIEMSILVQPPPLK